MDAEWLLAVIPEKDSDVVKWYKPVRDDFQIYYSESDYEPDFVVETRRGKFPCRSEMSISRKSRCRKRRAHAGSVRRPAL